MAEAAKHGTRGGLGGERRWEQHRDPRTDECYSPDWAVEWARAAMGGIDLDPASCEEAQRTVRADHYYTAEDDGLTREWFGRVWLNPPWGAGQKKRWVRKLRSEPDVEAWVCLLSADFTNRAMQDLACAADIIHFAGNQVRYRRPDGSETKGWFASALFCKGDMGALRVPPQRGRWLSGTLRGREQLALFA